MRVLAIDYGTKRVGLAISDRLGLLASPLQTLPNEGRRTLVQAVSKVVQAQEPERVLIGIPIRSDGTWRQEARRVLKFAHALDAVIDVPVTWLDEAFTTTEAHERLRDLRPGRRRRPHEERAIIDQIAAALILEEYLAALPEHPDPLPPMPPFEITP